MSEDYEAVEDEAQNDSKPAPKKADPEPKPKAKEDPDPMHFGMSREEIAKVRHDIYRMWHAEPEETR